MIAQTEFDFSGRALRDQGIAHAVAHADRKVNDWSLLAWLAFERYLGRMVAGETFQIEDFRSSIHGVPDPPSLRAFGFLPKRALKLGLIESAGTSKVKNPKAHMANSAVWKKL